MQEVLWDLQQYSEEDRINAESNLQLRSLLNPTIKATATVQTKPKVLGACYDKALQFADGIL